MKLVIHFTDAQAYAFLGTLGIGRDVLARYRGNHSHIDYAERKVQTKKKKKKLEMYKKKLSEEGRSDARRK